MADQVTLREYDTVLEAKEAEQQLVLGGISGVSRTGKKLKVDAGYETQALAIIGGSTTNGSASTASSVTDAATNAASTAADTTAQAASTVANTAANAASTVADTATNAASTVADAATQVATSAAETVQDAASAVSTQASKVTNVAANTVRDFADTVREQGAGPDASRVQRQAAETTAGVLEKTSEYIQPGGIQTLLGDLRSSIQRHPIRSLLIGLSLGYLVRSQYFPGQASTTSTQLSTPTPPTPPAPPSTPGYTTIDTTPAPLASTAAFDAPLGTTDLDTTDMLVGDDVLDTGIMTDVDDFATGTTLAGTGSMLDSDLSIDSDFSAVGSDDIDAMIAADDTLLDATLNVDTMNSGSSDLLDTDLAGTGTSYGSEADVAYSSEVDMLGDGTLADTPTTPLSTGDMSGGDLSSTSDMNSSPSLGDIAADWDARTRGEGSRE